MLRSQRALPAALALTGLVAVLPTGWLGWTAVLAEVLSVPLQPLADAGLRLSGLVRAPSDLAAESEIVRRKTEELETARYLLHQTRLENEDLRQEIAALQQARQMRPGVEMMPVYARITGRAPDRGLGPVRLSAGARDGVVDGAIAVYLGGHLVGRAGGVSRLTSRLVPITDTSTGLIEALIYPADKPLADLAGRPRLQLAPDGAGGLTGDLDREVAVRAGDVVRLADPAWPTSAQGLILGTVRAVTPKDLQPLLNVVTVEPRYHAQRIANVTLLVERSIETAQGSGEDRP